MKLLPLNESIFQAIEEFEIVDAHEHLPPEKVRLEQNVDVFTLFSNYTKLQDLPSSGMPNEFLNKINNSSIKIEKRWKMFAPYLKRIRYGSYARPAFIAAKEFYGFDDINEKNYKALSERIAAENKPGIYNKVLREKCNIRVALTESIRIFPEVSLTDYDLDLLVPLMHLYYADVQSKKSVEEYTSKLGEKVKTLDDYLEFIRSSLKKWKSMGVVGLKMWTRPYYASSKKLAYALFKKLMLSKGKKLSGLDPLYFFLMEKMLDIAAELRLVIAVHTGMWDDFMDNAPQHMIPIIKRHPKTRFDIYHLGIPYVREAILLGKSFSNVWLNLCWCHVISPRITCSAMDELIDMVPINKIIAFGGDYTIPVEKVYGHLVMARENVAKVLGHRVEEGLMTENEAIEIAKKWFYDNPKKLYQLKI